MSGNEQIGVEEVMVVLKIGTVTTKSDGKQYAVYRVPGDHGDDYPVWTRNGYACRCYCKSKQFHPSKPCKHQVRLQQWLDTQRRTSPLYYEPWALVKER